MCVYLLVFLLHQGGKACEAQFRATNVGSQGSPTPLPFFLPFLFQGPLPRTQDFQPLEIPSSPLLRARNPASGSEAWVGPEASPISGSFL